MTPITRGVEESSWVLRSRFSTAAPPTTAEEGRSARSRSTVLLNAGSEGSTVGTAWISAWSVPSAAGMAGMAPLIPGSEDRTLVASRASALSTTIVSVPGAPSPKAFFTRS